MLSQCPAVPSNDLSASLRAASALASLSLADSSAPWTPAAAAQRNRLRTSPAASNGNVMVFDSYKVANRHQNSHAIINAAFNFVVDSAYQNIQNSFIVSALPSAPFFAFPFF
jgi:hypothetical protein